MPLPPILYEINKTKKKDKNSSDLLAFSDFRAGENGELEKRYRLYCFKVLKKIGLEILQNTYLPEKTHWVVIRASEWIDIILPVIEDKAVHNMIYA